MFTINTILEATTQMLINGKTDQSLMYSHTLEYYIAMNINRLELIVKG